MTTEIKMPRISETMKDGKIVVWYKKQGDIINKGDIIAEVETDKANMEIEAVDSGTLDEILTKEGDIAKVGDPIAILDGKAKIITEEKAAPKISKEELFETVEKEKIIEETPGIIKASPMARKLAKEKAIDLSSVKGTGPGGRITESDVQLFIKPQAVTMKFEEKEVSKLQEEAEVEIRPLSRMRKTIAQRMSESKQTIPHFYVTYEVNADKLIEYYYEAKEKISSQITYNDIFIKAVALVLEKYPIFNSEFKDEQINIHKRINIGVAVAVEEGLLVPVVHDCNKKNLKEISDDTKFIKEKVKNNKLTSEDITGGTFTVSNMGMSGVKEFAAIINPPEAAGLAIGAIMKSPVIKDEQIVIGNVVNLTLSADHRIVDGLEAARFLNDFKYLLENPQKIQYFA